MLPRLRVPTVLRIEKNMREFMWTVPKPYAPKLIELLETEAQIQAQSSDVDKEEAMVSCTYQAQRSNFIVFACLEFVDHYNNCRVLQNSYDMKDPNSAEEEEEDVTSGKMGFNSSRWS